MSNLEKMAEALIAGNVAEVVSLTNAAVAAGDNAGDITDSSAVGDVIATLDFMSVGGLVGTNTLGTLTNCYATGNVQTVGPRSGGLMGHSGGTVINCYATGSVEGNHYVGGLIGYNVDGGVVDSYATGAAQGDHRVGGLIGESTGAIIDCHNLNIREILLRTYALERITQKLLTIVGAQHDGQPRLLTHRTAPLCITGVSFPKH